MGENTRRDPRHWDDWLKEVEIIERKHPNQRAVSVSIPGGLPQVGWNVPNNLYRGHSQVDSNNVANMRMGVYGSFRVEDGDFAVRFNDGEVVT